MNRRDFLKAGTVAAGLLGGRGWGTGSAWGADRSPPPSERITVGLIGRGLMGNGHLRRLSGDPEVEVLAVCDVDVVRREAGRRTVVERQAGKGFGDASDSCGIYNDFREVLARPDLDAVVIVTPDHWHALMAIEAAKAGKDVYCEKPISLTVEEGRRVVEAMHRYDRVFQTGTQYRSIPTIRRVCQFIRAGGLGKVRSVFTLLNRLEHFIGAARFHPYAVVMDIGVRGRSYTALDFPLPAEPVPEGLDWDLWLGPAPERPYNQLYHINPSPGVVPWSFCEDFGVASLTWHLSHSADVIQHALGAEYSGPVEMIHPRQGPYPTLTCRYANGTLLHFVDHWGMVKDLYRAVPATARLAGNFGGVFVGERGWVTTMSTGGPVEGGPEDLLRDMDLRTREVNIGANDHHANWLECIRTRKKPSSDEKMGHRSASLGHLAMIAYTLDRSLTWDPEREEFVSDPEANRLRARTMREPWQ